VAAPAPGQSHWGAASGDVERTSAAAEILGTELDALGRLPFSAVDVAWQALVGD
jgi:hypothetical protein